MNYICIEPCYVQGVKRFSVGQRYSCESLPKDVEKRFKKDLSDNDEIETNIVSLSEQVNKLTKRVAALEEAKSGEKAVVETSGEKEILEAKENEKALRLKAKQLGVQHSHCKGIQKLKEEIELIEKSNG